MNVIPFEKLPTNNSIIWKKPSHTRDSQTIPAESDPGKMLYKILDAIQKQKIGTVTISSDDVRLDRELADIQQDCSAPDWDGYGAEPIDRMSIQHICRFLDKLPSNISYPELAPESTGDLTMIWRKRGYHLVVGIDKEGQIAWGGTSPEGHVYGDAKFDVNIAEELIDLLCSVEGIR